MAAAWRRRELIASTDLSGYLDWPGVPQVFRLERTWREHGQTEAGAALRHHQPAPAAADAARLLALRRGHWSIENRLHRRKDVTFGEDASLIHVGQGPTVMAAAARCGGQPAAPGRRPARRRPLTHPQPAPRAGRRPRRRPPPHWRISPTRSGGPLQLGGAERGEVLGGGAVAQGLVWADVMVVRLPGAQCCLERGQFEGAVVALPELAAAGAGGPLDVAVELGRTGRQDVQGDLLRGAGRLDLGHELRAAVDLDGAQGKGMRSCSSARKSRRGAGGGRGPHPGTLQRETTSTALNWRRSTPGNGVRCMVSSWTRSPGCATGWSWGVRMA